MPEETIFTMTLEPALHAAFLAQAAAENRPASQIVSELMRDYVAQHQPARDHDDYRRGKIDAARASMRAGLGRPNDESKPSTPPDVYEPPRKTRRDRRLDAASRTGSL